MNKLLASFLKQAYLISPLIKTKLLWCPRWIITKKNYCFYVISKLCSLLKSPGESNDFCCSYYDNFLFVIHRSKTWKREHFVPAHQKGLWQFQRVCKKGTCSQAVFQQNEPPPLHGGQQGCRQCGARPKSGRWRQLQICGRLHSSHYRCSTEVGIRTRQFSAGWNLCLLMWFLWFIYSSKPYRSFPYTIGEIASFSKAFGILIFWIQVLLFLDVSDLRNANPTFTWHYLDFIHTLMARFNLKVYSGMQVCQEKSQICKKKTYSECHFQWCAMIWTQRYCSSKKINTVMKTWNGKQKMQAQPFKFFGHQKSNLH